MDLRRGGADEDAEDTLAAAAAIAICAVLVVLLPEPRECVGVDAACGSLRCLHLADLLFPFVCSPRFMRWVGRLVYSAKRLVI